MKKGLLMFALVMIAVFIGNLIGELSLGVAGMEWLGKGYEIGISTTELDLHLIVLTFGIQVRVCIAEVVLLLAALIGYPKLAKLIFS